MSGDQLSLLDPPVAQVRSSDFYGPLCAWPECPERRRPGRHDPLCSTHRTRLLRGGNMQAPRRRRPNGTPAPECYVKECSNPALSAGLCAGHWRRQREGRSLDGPLANRAPGTPAERLWRSVDKTPGGCWLWTLTRDRMGYGWIGVNGRKVAVHRLAYELLRGPIPDGLHIDHLCRTPPCVNPDHLEPVTQAENNRRALPFRPPRQLKTHCPHGHPYSGDNLYVRADGSRYCRACGRLRRARWRAARGAA